MADSNRTAHPSIAVVADPAHTLWDAVASAWPSYAPTPTPAFYDLREAATIPPEALPPVTLARATDDHTPLYKLIDRLWALDRAAVIIASDNDDRAPRLTARGVVVLPESAGPLAIASTLHALITRQADVDSLASELRTARRFQGGIRGEMERMHDELQLAASIQREFLPPTMPAFDAVSFHVLFRPCAYVSGDIYDVTRLDERHAGFFLADAAGHGVPAALMTMVMARALVTTRSVHGRREIIPPAEVLTHLNAEMIRRQGGIPRFATGVYGIIDTHTRKITLAAAGHPHPLVLEQGGASATPLKTDGALLGIFDDATFEEVTIDLDERSMLLIYSDGFETAFPVAAPDGTRRIVPNEEYVNRFADVARVWGDTGIDAGLASLGASLDNASGSLHQLDDLTALAIAPRRATGQQSGSRAA